MIIRTTRELEDVDCCGCLPAECDPFKKECESITGFSQVGYATYISLTQTYYGKSRDDYSDGGFWQKESISSHWTDLGGESIEPVALTYTEADPQTGTLTNTLSNIVDIDASRTSALAAMQSALDWDGMTKGVICNSKRIEMNPAGSFPAYHLQIVFSRYRMGVPDSMLPPNPSRSTYEMQWDEVFFPTSGTPALVISRSWEWDGDTGNPWSGWFEIEVPEEAGETRVVNVMVKCYKSTRLGVKPTAHGESYEIPPP